MRSQYREEPTKEEETVMSMSMSMSVSTLSSTLSLTAKFRSLSRQKKLTAVTNGIAEPKLGRLSVDDRPSLAALINQRAIWYDT